MEPTWQPPETWLKEGSTFAGVTHLKTGAWTTILTAKESGGPAGAQGSEVIIKTFSVPPGVHEDEKRIASEREKFLRSAYLQKSLTDGTPPAKGWVKIFRIAEDPVHPSFTMEKCGPSVEDLFDHRVNQSAKSLYALVHCVLDALIELKDRAKRSHGNLKISDVLSSLPGQTPAFKLADPASKGEDHSANDLFSLGQILFKLIESKDWDPMIQILPTSHWNRFGVRRDRWIQFCNLLLSPNGCHQTLQEVKREAGRLKPVSSLRPVYIAMAGLALVAAGGVGYHFLLGKAMFGTQTAGTQSATEPTIKISSIVVDPKLKESVDAANSKYKNMHAKWLALQQTPRYDHTQSRKLAQTSRAMLPDQVVLTDAASYTNAVDFYSKATDKLQEAIDAETAEESAGQKQDAGVLAEFQAAQKDYAAAQAAWEDTVKKFTPGADHTRSRAMADAALLKKNLTPSDLAGFHSAADQYRAAITKLNEAAALVPGEEKSALDEMDAKSAFENSRKRYQELRARWDALPADPGLDLAQAKATAEAARKSLPEQFVLTDPASYRTSAGLYQSAAKKLDEAFTQVEKAKHNFVAQETDVATAVAKANQALKEKKYPQAFSYYKQAADMGNAPAMCNVGILYETGQGVTKDYAEAARWYRKAAELKNPSAMADLAYLYRMGRGVEKDFGVAMTWYKKAAELNNTESMCALASLYENGQGVDRDYDQAMAWYKKAAGLNNSVAMNNVGVFYEKGRGVPVDYAAAMEWYKKSAALNNAAAMNDIGALYDNGHGVPTNSAAAMEWYTKSAALNYAPAMCNIGTLYDNGQGVTLDHVEAMKWFRKAADLNHGMAMYNVGVLYETGRGVAVDTPEALTWYRKAAKSDDAAARQLATERLDKLGYSH